MPHTRHATNQQNTGKAVQLSMKTETHCQKQPSVPGLPGIRILGDNSAPFLPHTPAPTAPPVAPQPHCRHTRVFTQNAYLHVPTPRSIVNTTEWSQKGNKARDHDFNFIVLCLLGIQLLGSCFLESTLPHLSVTSHKTCRTYLGIQAR